VTPGDVGEESEKNSVRQIIWEDGSESGAVLRPDPPDRPGGTVETPWSVTVEFEKADRVAWESATSAGAMCDAILGEVFGGGS